MFDQKPLYLQIYLSSPFHDAQHGQTPPQATPGELRGLSLWRTLKP